MFSGGIQRGNWDETSVYPPHRRVQNAVKHLRWRALSFVFPTSHPGQG